jgi:hypothetical protein
LWKSRDITSKDPQNPSHCKTKTLHYENKALFVDAWIVDAWIMNDSHCEILGQNSHTVKTLSSGKIFDDIKEKSLIDVKLIIFYRHKGIQKTVRETFLGLIWKMCYLHLIRQVLKKVIKEAKKGVMKLKEASIDHKILISNVNFNILSVIYRYSWANDKGKYQPTIWCKSYSYPHFEFSLSFTL